MHYVHMETSFIKMKFPLNNQNACVLFLFWKLFHIPSPQYFIETALQLPTLTMQGQPCPSSPTSPTLGSLQCGSLNCLVLGLARALTSL